MKRWALVNSGKILNVVEQSTKPEIEGEWVDCTGALVGPGDLYSNGVFSKYEEPKSYRITVLAFLSRFTDAEAIAIDLASIGTTVQAATLRRYMQKVTSATYIDLEREDTVAGVQALETMNILASGRAAQILSKTISDSERPR